MGYSVFVAHAEVDATFAEQLKRVIVDLVGLTQDEVFVSSIPGTIACDAEFPAAVRSALRETPAVVLLVTPDSIWRPWLHFEAGGAWIARNRGLFVAVAAGFPPSALPSNLLFHSATSLENPDGVRALCRDLRTLLRTEEPRAVTNDSLSRLTTIAAPKSIGWKFVSTVLAAPRQSLSPFQALPLLKHTRKVFAACGQNLHYRTQSDETQDLKRELFKFLERDPPGEALFLLQRKGSAGTRSWRTVFGDLFETHLDKTIRKLSEWREEAARKNLGTLLVKVFELIPMTLTISDPREPTGTVFVTPIMPRSPQSGLRPVFRATRQDHPEIVDAYWESFRDTFHDAEELP